jgi:hypothetical protein
MTLTGWIHVDRGGPYNVQLNALVEGRGGRFLWITEMFPCVNAGRNEEFEIVEIAVPPSRPRLRKVEGIVTTVEGFGDIDEPPGCQPL